MPTMRLVLTDAYLTAHCSRRCPTLCIALRRRLFVRASALKAGFFSQAEYESGYGRHSTVSHFKGLGTSSSEDAKTYFKNLPNHRFPVNYTGARTDAVKLFFANDRADDRKQVLTYTDLSAYLQYGTDDITTTASCTPSLPSTAADNRRSLASMVDGMKFRSARCCILL